MKTLLALEPRILFDGAALVTGAEVVQDQTTQDHTTQDHAQPQPDTQTGAESNSEPLSETDDFHLALSTLSAPSDRREIVFIDTRVQDYYTLLNGIDPNVEAVLLDPTRDGVEQIAEILSGRTDIDAIHFIAEGNEAELHLGTSFLTQESISGRYADLFAQIGQSLSAEADLLIYGCNFGQGDAGLGAMKTLAELTGADIAASTDRTGHATEFANWQLEIATGTIESSIVIGETTRKAWEGVLATYTVTTTTDGGAGSLRQAIINANANSGTDTITFVGNGTYLLTIAGTGENAAATGDLDITESLIITGNGVGNTVIDGGGIDRVFNIRNNSTVVTMSGLTIQGGSADHNAGGIFVENLSTLNISDALLQNNNGNNASGGGEGGAIHVHGTLNADRVLIFNNTAKIGGGIRFHGAVGGTLTNVTISGNTAVVTGGGIDTDTAFTVTNSTITLNNAGDAGGIFNSGPAVTISNTIVSGNTATSSNKDVVGTFSSNGFNLIGVVGTATGFGSDLTGVSANLGGLADNSGPTQTHALLVGSPAIDAGTSAGAPAVDQRGVPRDASVDIGAFESISNSPPVINDQVFPIAENSANGTSVGSVVGTDADPQKGYSKLYWVDLDTDEVRRINLDGSGSQQLAVQFDGTGATGPRGVTVDDVNGKVYWTNNTTNTLWRADLDGGNPQQLLAGLGGPLGITVDPAGGKIYWIDTAATAIWHANLDGGSPAALITGITNSKDLTVDSTGGKLYWTDKGTGTINRANLNGSTIETIVSGLNDPWGIALDVTAGKVYWSDATLNQIQRANMTVGATAQTVVTGANQPRDLTLDLVQGKIYWTAATTDRIESATFAGSPLPPVTATGDWPSGLAIGPAVRNLTYAIISGNTGGAFAINAVSGELTVVNSAALDYETNPSFGLTVQLTDSLGLNDTATITINLSGVNEAPSLSGLDNAPTFTEGGAAVVLDNNATIADPELNAANNYSGATLTLARNGGANAQDIFAGSGTLSSLVESGSLVVGGTTIGTVTTNSAGTLVLTFNSNATTALVNSALQQITYANSSSNPPASVQINFTIDDGNAGGQGSGGALNDTGSITVTINAVNTAPTVDLDANNSSGATGNDYGVTFTEGSAPVAIADTDTDLVDVDSTTFAYVELAVSGLLDGNAETLVLDGNTFALATAVAGQDTTGGNYRVVITTGAGTATVTITKQGGGTFTEIETETLITAMQYQHTDTSAPTDGNRLIDVTVNDGTTDSASARTTINVNPVNMSPLATPDSYTIDEDTTLTTEPTWFDQAWQSRQKLTLNNTAQVENLADFPVLITLDAGRIDYTKVQNAGEDLRFVDPDGTELAYEIESWDEAGTSYVWVKVPQIDAASGTDYIWMYYDNAGAADNQNAAGVWSNGFEVLSHLHDDFTDSTGNAHNGINSGSLDITGTIGDGQSFDGIDDRIDIPSGAGIDNIFTGGATVSAWINPSTWGEGGFGRILDKGNAVAVTNGWALQIENTGNRLIFELGFSGNTGRWRASLNSISLDTWQLVTVAYDSSSAANDPTIYVNGVAIGLTESSTPSGTANSDAGLDLAIGNRSGSTDRTFQGILDEVRLETGTRSADWVKAQYLSMTDAFVTFATAEGPGGVLANDTDADGDPLTAIQVSANPANAQSFVLNSDGSFSYSPVANFTGVDTFTYKVNDGTVDGNTVVVTINVTPVNDAPLVATNTGTTVDEASSGNIITSAMLNEGDPDDAGTGLTYTVTAVTTNGTLRLSGTPLGVNDTFTQDDIDSNRVTYDHNGSETTTDSFSFSLADGGENGATPATGMFPITITPVNDPPTATIIASSFGVNEDDTFRLLGGVSVSDIDAGTNDLSVTLSVNDGLLRLVTTTGLTFASGANDSATMTVTGTTTNLNNALATLRYQPDPDFAGTDLLTLMVDDLGNTGGGSLTAMDTANIVVAPINDSPSFNGLDQTPTFIQGGAAVVLDNNATITDPELDAANNYNGATLTLVRNGGASGNDVFNGSGTLLPLVESGSLVMSGTTIGTVTTNSGGILVLTFNGNATTALVNSALQRITYANSSGSPPASVQIDFSIDDGNAGSQGSGGALTDTGSITVTINATNIPPVAVADGFTVTQGSTTILNLAGNDLDPDDGLDLTSITIVTGPTNGTIASINADGTVTYTHNGSATVTDSFTYTINDLAAATSNTVTVSLVVNLLNVPPVALADSFTVTESTTTTLNLAGNDIDLDDGLDLASITIVTGPTNGTITSINTDGTVTYTHNGSETLSDSFTYTIKDLSGATSNTVTVSLTVTPVNDSPTLRNVPLALNPGIEDEGPPVGVVGTLVSSLVDLDTIPGGRDNVTDPDSGGVTGMAVTQVNTTNGTWFYSTDNGANWFSLNGVNPNAARLLAADGATRIYFQPNPNFFGTVLSGITFRAWDQVNGSNGAIGNTTPPGGTSGFSTAQATADITINPVGDAPIITSNGGGASANITVVMGNTAVTDVDASDADGDILTYSILGGADAALFSIDPTTGVLTFRTAPDFLAPGDAGADNVYDVIVQASDGTAVDTQALAVTVTQAIVAPPIFNPPPPNPPPSSDPPPREIGGETSEDQAPVSGGSIDPSSPGNLPGGGQGAPNTGARDSDAGQNLAEHEVAAKPPREEGTGILERLSDLWEGLPKSLDLTALKDEIRSLLTRHRFLQDLDRVRDNVQDVTATEQTYVASSIAVSTGLSIGYVIWLLRSGVLLTALLSSVPAWQFVNPLLVLDAAAKKKRQKGQKDGEEDSVESLFEKPAAAADTTDETKDGLISRTRKFLQPRRTDI